MEKAELHKVWEEREIGCTIGAEIKKAFGLFPAKNQTHHGFVFSSKTLRLN